MQNPRFRKTPLSAGIAVALGAMTLSPAMAQDASEEVMEEIVTVGIRGSLMQSMDRKRNSKGVVDAITAEDIGKFPDSNLAESLQRITGVSIDRSNGEGAKITVRGMGPEFNLVTLNGRSMPNAGSRSFDFSDIASEAVSAVEIYKTGKANLPTGGIGAIVNMQTAKPLTNPGFKSAVSAKVVHETSSSNGDLDDFTPEIAGLFSNTFADDTFGILISASHQVRDNREENAAVDSWIQNRPMNTAANIVDNNQRADGTTWYPQNAGYGWSDISRERTNGQLVLQYAPTDRLTATLDYTYSKVDFEKESNSFGVWFDAGGAMSSATINERGTFTEVTEAGGDYSTNIGRDHTEKENNSIGLNLDWQATDTLNLTLDVHDSSSNNRGAGLGSLPGSESSLIIGNTFCDWCGTVPGAGPSTATLGSKTATYGPGGIPIWDFTVTDTATGLPIADLRDSDIGSLFGQAFDTDVDNEITQIQLGGSWENDDGGAIASIDFGYALTEQEFKSRDAFSGQLPAGFWLTSAVHWADDQWQRGSTSGLLDGFSNGGSFPIDYYYTAGFDYVVDQWETVGDTDCCIADLYWPGWGPDFQDTANGRGQFWSGPTTAGNVIEETIDSFYTQINIEDDFNGMAFNAVIGLRYEESEVKSTGLETPPSAVVWIGGNEWTYESSTTQTPSVGGSTTKQWLPSLDTDMEVYEDVIARFSYSRSLARPPIGDMGSNRSFPGTPKLDTRQINVGNPGLLPYLSDNFDLSLEYYYGNGSYASVGYFKKAVDNFLVGSTSETTVPGILDPYSGPRAEQARAELELEGTIATNTAVFERINLNMGVPITTPIRAEAGDPLVVFQVSSQENAKLANLSGWEIAVQHIFADSGFGVLFNATIVNGDVEADRDLVGQQFALNGMSDSANLSVFYENDTVSARLAYNWRDEFLSGFDNASSPVFAEEYFQLDGNVTYNVNDNLAVFFEALNITEEVQRSYVRYPDQFLRGNQYGARYNIGARYNFD
jgi:TonB-dependent receptor